MPRHHYVLNFSYHVTKICASFCAREVNLLAQRLGRVAQVYFMNVNITFQKRNYKVKKKLHFTKKIHRQLQK